MSHATVRGGSGEAECVRQLDGDEKRWNGDRDNPSKPIPPSTFETEQFGHGKLITKHPKLFTRFIYKRYSLLSIDRSNNRSFRKRSVAFLNHRIVSDRRGGFSRRVHDEKKKYISLSPVERKKNRTFREGRKEGRFSPSHIYSLEINDTRGKQRGRSIEGEIDRYRYPSQRGKENLFREWKSILFRNRLSSVSSERLLCVIELVHYSFRLIPPPSGTDFISVNEISCKIFLERDSFSRSIREKLVRNVRSLVSQISLFFYYTRAKIRYFRLFSTVFIKREKEKYKFFAEAPLIKRTFSNARISIDRKEGIGASVHLTQSRRR